MSSYARDRNMLRGHENYPYTPTPTPLTLPSPQTHFNDKTTKEITWKCDLNYLQKLINNSKAHWPMKWSIKHHVQWFKNPIKPPPSVGMRCLMFFSYTNFQRSQKHHCYELSRHTPVSRNVFEAVQKTRSTCFIGSKTTRLGLLVLNPDKTLLLVF